MKKSVQKYQGAAHIGPADLYRHQHFVQTQFSYSGQSQYFFSKTNTDLQMRFTLKKYLPLQ